PGIDITGKPRDPDEQRILGVGGVQQQKSLAARKVLRVGGELKPARPVATGRAGTDAAVAQVPVLDTDAEPVHRLAVPRDARVSGEILRPDQHECRAVRIDKILRSDAALIGPMTWRGV